MNLDRILFVVEFEGGERVEAFLSSEDVRKSKFGDFAAPAQSAPVKHLLQPDGFRITAGGKRLQVNYTLPREVAAVEEDPFSHIADRLKRFIRAVSSLGDGKAKWVGMQAFFEESEPDEASRTGKGALAAWAKRTDAPMFAGIVPTQFSFVLGFEHKELFESITIQPYEIRMGTFDKMPVGEIDVEKVSEVTNAGMQFLVDINTRPRTSADRTDRLSTIIMERLRSGYQEIIERGISAVKGRPTGV